MELTVAADRRLIRAQSSSVRYVRAHIEAPAAPARHGRIPVNVAFVLDRSGSMAGQKIELAKQAVIAAIRTLRAEDRFSVVVYDDVVDLVVGATAATVAARTEAEGALRQIQARNMTNLGGGWLLGCEQVAAVLRERDVARCLLMTDGLANVGITDPAELVRHARELAGRGIATTTFGVGEDFNENLLHNMAQSGNGNFYYVEQAAQIPDYVASEMGETLEVVAQDVALYVDAPAGVAVTSLNERPTGRDGGHTTVQLGSLVSEQVLDAVLKIEFPTGKIGEVVNLAVGLTDRDGALGGRAAELSFEYASHADNDRQDRNREVDLEVARVYAALAQAEALGHNRAGDYKAAEKVLLGTARRIRSYAGSDPSLLALAEELEGLRASYTQVMAVHALKSQYFASSAALRGKDASGRSVRKPKGS